MLQNKLENQKWENDKTNNTINEKYRHDHLKQPTSELQEYGIQHYTINRNV